MTDFHQGNSQDQKIDSSAHLAQALIASSPELLEFAVLVGRALQKFATWVADAAIQAEERYERGLALQAYRTRRRWKTIDVARVRALPQARLSDRRLARLEAAPKRGRPVVPEHQPLPAVIARRARAASAFFDPATLPHTRIGLLKLTHFWPFFAEALYRGCYVEAKLRGIAAPSVEAETRAADLLLISTARLRKICTAIRRETRADPAARWPAIICEEFKHWRSTGELPAHN
jgi:hypothetical protein